MNIRFGTLAAFSVLLGALTTAGCSLALDFEQCQSEADCDSYGPGAVCGSDNVCLVSDVTVDEDCSKMVCDTTINIGNVSAQNGPNANLGEGMVVGFETAFLEINDAGGIMGRQLNLVVRDDGYEPENTGLAMQDLILGGSERKVLAIVGNVGTPTAAVAVPIAKDNDVVFHGAFTGAGLLREDPPAKVIFNYRASYVQETSAIVAHLTQERDIAIRVPPQNIGVLAQGNSAAAGDPSAFDGYGTAGFTGVAQALGETISENDIAVASYERNTANVDVATEHFVRWLAGPDSVETDGVVRAAIIMVPTADPAANLVISMRDAISAAESDVDPQGISLTVEERAKLAKADLFMASVSFVGSDKLRDNLREQSAEYCPGVAVSQVVPFPAGSSSGALAYQAALAAYNAAEGTAHQPGFVSFEGYLAGRLFTAGLANAPSLDTEGVVAGLQSLSAEEYGIGTTLTFGVDDHQASDKVFGTQLTADCEFEVLDFGN